MRKPTEIIVNARVLDEGEEFLFMYTFNGMPQIGQSMQLTPLEADNFSGRQRIKNIFWELGYLNVVI